MFIVFDSVRRHKISDYAKKALQFMRKYSKIHVGTSSVPGRTALRGVTSLSKTCSSLQQEARGFPGFALFFDWASGSGQVMPAQSRSVYCFIFCLTTQNQGLRKESSKIDAKILENTRTCDVRQYKPAPGQGQSVHGADSGRSAVCAWFCALLSVLRVPDWCCAVQCQHGTLGECL